MKNQPKKQAASPALLDEIRTLRRELQEGRLDRRANSAGPGREVLEEVNGIIDNLVTPLRLATTALGQLGRGEVPELVTAAYQGELADLKANVNDTVEMVKMRRADIEMLLANALEGKLDARGDVSRYKHHSGSTVQTVNAILDAILLPIGEGNRILAQISGGKIDELISQTYKGDHEKMKQAVNNVAVVLQGLQKELNRLTQASHEGQLAERGKPDQFQGAYAEIVRGVNTMLDAILLPIGEGNRILAQISGGKIDELIAQTYKGDHEKMKQAVNNVGVVLQGLQKELNRLTQASHDGQLAERGKPDQFQGAYAEIVRGVNTMLDAILAPLNVSANYVDRISGGKIDELI